MKIGHKIRFFREERNLTQQELANLAGVSDKTIQRYEKSDDENLTTNVIKKIAMGLNLNVDVLTQEKVAKNVPQSKENMSLNTANLTNSQQQQLQNEQIYITSLNSAVGAGESVDIDGIEVFDSDILIPFSKLLFKTPPNFAKLRCMRVDGYSMIPLLYPDSWVIAEISSQFQGDGLYIINFSGNFMVKMVQKSPNGVLDIISINKDYKSYTISEDNSIEIQIIAKVLRCVI